MQLLEMFQAEDDHHHQINIIWSGENSKKIKHINQRNTFTHFIFYFFIG